MSNKAKIDLSLLKRLVSELETELTAVETINPKERKEDYVVELSKAAGVAVGVMTEAAALVGDIQYIATGGPTASSSGDLLGKLFPGLKGPGNTN